MQHDVTLIFESFDETEPPEDFKGTLRSFMSPADAVGFERHFKRPVPQDPQEPGRAEYVLWFIWRAWRRETRTPLDFDPFLEALTEFDLPDDEEAEEGGEPAVPTEQASDPPSG